MAKKNINSIRPVLIEMIDDNFVSGLTDNYIRVKVLKKGLVEKFIDNLKIFKKEYI